MSGHSCKNNDKTSRKSGSSNGQEEIALGDFGLGVDSTRKVGHLVN